MTDVPETDAVLMRGQFAMISTPGGGLVLVTDVEGRGVETRRIPAAIVRRLSGKGAFAAMAKKMFGDLEPEPAELPAKAGD